MNRNYGNDNTDQKEKQGGNTMNKDVAELLRLYDHVTRDMAPEERDKVLQRVLRILERGE